VWLCHIPHSYSLLRHRIAPSSVVCQSVFMSLCQCVTLVSPPENGWNDQVAICVPDSGGPNEPCITWGPDANMGRAIFRGNRQTIVNYRDTPRSSVQRWLNRSRCRFWILGSHGPKASRVTWEFQIPHGKGQFWWIGAPIIKYRHFLP